ncbi:Bifunctional arginine demethylase and lysyl-hydroxylase JMJD6, partial [Trichinella zimbabwensis]
LFNLLQLNMEKKLHKRINEVRAKVRSELSVSEWQSLRLAERFCLDGFLCVDNIERIDGLQCSVEEFVLPYESKSCPVLITNLQCGWAAHEKWTVEKLYRNIAINFSNVEKMMTVIS